MRSTPFDNSIFGDFDDLFHRMNRQFEDMNRMWERRGVGSPVEIAFDVADHDDEIVVTADLPGFERDDIDVSVSDRTLTVAADRDAESEHEAGEYIQRERRRSSVRRSITLPADTDEDAATARYVNGVLTVTLPKSEREDDPRHIDVE